MLFDDDYRWQRRFIPEMKAIIGLHLISEADPEEDQNHNTDLIVLRMEAIRVACRVRRNKFLIEYGDQFTVRADRPSGAKTELAKIIEGWGDYILYGFCDEYEERLCSWFIGDLKAFRLWHSRQLASMSAKQLPGVCVANHDGSSSFRAYHAKELPDNFFVASEDFPHDPWAWVS